VIGDVDGITERIIGAAIDVHRALGPGLMESAYEECLAAELADRRLRFARQVPVPLVYKGRRLDCAYRIDFLVEFRVVVEIKALDRLQPIHEAQLLTYLRLGGWHIGLLLNFHVPVLRDGIRRLVLGNPDESPSSCPTSASSASPW
jgi:GxxExxY protein